MSITFLSRLERVANARLEPFRPRRIRIRIRYRRSVREGIDFIFVRFPRTASTTVLHHLEDDFGCLKLKRLEEIKAQEIRGPLSFSHVSIKMLREENLIPEDFYQRAFKFSFVRNPYARAVSLFEYYRQIRILPKEMSFSTFLHMLKYDEIRPIGLYNSSSLSLCHPQHAWLEDVNVDFIGRTENLEHDLSHIYRKMGRDLQANGLVHLRTSTKGDHMDFYSSKEIEIVNGFYEGDFERFDYEMH